jgi:hypothetical protein
VRLIERFDHATVAGAKKLLPWKAGTQRKRMRRVLRVITALILSRRKRMGPT